MTTLEQIGNAALRADSSLPELLRLCLAHARANALSGLEDWATLELTGYGDTVELPPYRLLPAVVRGNFSSPYGSGMQHAVIDSGGVAPENRQGLFSMRIAQPVAELAALATRSERIIEPWPGELVATYMRELYLGMTCLAAWREVSTAALHGVLDIVRTRVLLLALA